MEIMLCGVKDDPLLQGTDSVLDATTIFLAHSQNLQ